MATTRTSYLGVYQNILSMYPGIGCGVATPAPFHLGTWGPSGVPYTLSILSGAAPPGIAPFVCGYAGGSYFYMVGTPTALGVYTYTVRALNSGGGFAFDLDIVQTVATNALPPGAPGYPGSCPLVGLAPPTPLEDGAPDVPYSIELSATGGAGGPYTFDLAEGSTLPPGLILSSSGVLDGTPTTLGAYGFNVRATDAYGCLGITAYAMAVELPPITIAPETLADGARDVFYSQILTAEGGTGGPYTFAVVLSGLLPDGLSLSSAGLIDGMPTLPGLYNFTVRATDADANTGDQIYALLITGLSIVIMGFDRLLDIAQADFELGLNQRSTAHLVFGDGFIPDRLAEVVLYARDGVTEIFGGIILSRRVRGEVPGILANATEADCVDFSVYFDDASVTLNYAAPVAVEDVIADIVAQVLGDYGLTYTPVATGLTLAPFAWVNVIVTTAFKQISDKTGLVFRTSPTKAILAFVPGTDPAPVTIADANIHAFDLTWSDGARLTANTVELTCGPSGPGQMRQQWIADGIAASWVTDLPAIDPPPILVEIDDGVTPYLATVVSLGEGGGMFEWDRDTHTLSLGTDPLPAAGTLITLGPTVHFDSPATFYTVQFPFTVSVSNADSGEPPITYREARPDCVEYGPAVELAEGILARESAERRDLEVFTDEDGFLPGQALTVDTTARGGIAADFLVANVRAHIVNAEHWEYTLTAQPNAIYRGTYVDDWNALTGGGGAAAVGAAALVAPVSQPTTLTGDVTGSGTGSLATTLDAAAVAGDGLEDDGANNLRVKLDGSTVQRSAAGLKTAVAHPEIPTGAINGVNTVFTTSTPYPSGGLIVTKNGLLQESPTDYTETTDTTFTMVEPPVSTGTPDVIAVWFTSALAGGGNVAGPASSVASEAALFDGTTGKLLKRATGTGIVHRTSGVDSVSNVLESELTLADNTTADVSTTKHGFAPKAPADATKFLDGTGAWAVPAGGGGGSGALVQVVNTQTGAIATGTTLLPYDDTIPQKTEGDEYMTLAVTPTSATNNLRIDIVVNISPAAANERISAALFQDTATNALAAISNWSSQGASNYSYAFTHFMVAGTTSATTFKVRMGVHAGTFGMTFNGNGVSREFGGVMASSITISEIVP